MSCNLCDTKFNFFHKELGCSNCGLSFCNKCLSKKSKLCKKCFLKSSTGQSSEQSTVSPPDKFIKRLENLQNPTVEPVTIYRREMKPDLSRSDLSTADKELVKRFEKFKNDGKKPVPTDIEIRQRLAKLKDQNDYIETTSGPLITIDRRTDEEKIDSMMEQFSKENDIELAHDPVIEIEARLAALQEQDVKPNEKCHLSKEDSSGSEGEIDEITKKVMDEVALEEKLPTDMGTPTDDLSSIDDRPSSPELPWCVLCNDDASYRCIDCGDLYCASCNVEVHQKWGDDDHKVVAYKATK